MGIGLKEKDTVQAFMREFSLGSIIKLSWDFQGEY